MAGRYCSICYNGRRAEIEGALMSGLSVQLISRRFAVSDDSLYRHTSRHLGPEVREALREGNAIRVGDLLRRVMDVADGARAARLDAAAAGNHPAAVRAGDGEMRALSVIFDKFGVDDEGVADLLDQGEALAIAVQRLIKRTPSAGLCSQRSCVGSSSRSSLTWWSEWRSRQPPDSATDGPVCTPPRWSELGRPPSLILCWTARAGFRNLAHRLRREVRRRRPSNSPATSMRKRTRSDRTQEQASPPSHRAIASYARALSPLSADSGRLAEEIGREVHANEHVAQRTYRWASAAGVSVSNCARGNSAPPRRRGDPGGPAAPCCRNRFTQRCGPDGVRRAPWRHGRLGGDAVSTRCTSKTRRPTFRRA